MVVGSTLSRVSRLTGFSSGPLRVLLWVLAAVLTVAIAFSLYLALPIFLGGATGQSGQQAVEGYPSSVTATGDDGRTRTLSVHTEDGSDATLDALTPGDRLVVSGSGYAPDSGIYVAICRISEDPDEKPGPCLGGVPELDETEQSTPGAIEWAASNWINDDWAWKLFGARSFDSVEQGTFTAYLLVPPPADEFVNCQLETCGLYTRNDHTALDNRMQDIYLPVSFSE